MCWCAVETRTAVEVLLTFMLSVDLSFDMKKTRRVSWVEGAQSTTLNFYTWINHQNQVWCIYLFDHWGNVVKTTYTAVLFTLYTHSYIASIPLLMSVLLLGIFSCCLVLFVIIKKQENNKVWLFVQNAPHRIQPFKYGMTPTFPQASFHTKSLHVCTHMKQTRKKSHKWKNLTLFSKTDICLLRFTNTPTPSLSPSSLDTDTHSMRSALLNPSSAASNKFSGEKPALHSVPLRSPKAAARTAPPSDNQL